MSVLDVVQLGVPSLVEWSPILILGFFAVSLIGGWFITRST